MSFKGRGGRHHVNSDNLEFVHVQAKQVAYTSASALRHSQSAAMGAGNRTHVLQLSNTMSLKSKEAPIEHRQHVSAHIERNCAVSHKSLLDAGVVKNWFFAKPGICHVITRLEASHLNRVEIYICSVNHVSQLTATDGTKDMN